MKAEASFQEHYRENLDMSWIYHDSALEGVVYTFQELRTAVDPTAQVVADSSLQPACEEIRRHREALHFIRDYAPKKRQPITVDLVREDLLILHPEEGDLKTVKYRKDIPQHRLYFHEYAPPDKITYKVRAIIEWVNDPETRRTRSPIRLAARAHYDLLRVFPFPTDSGKVARLFMNLLLLRSRIPPGNRPLDRATALLRRAQGLEHGDDGHRAGGDRQQPRLRREVTRGARGPSEPGRAGLTPAAGESQVKERLPGSESFTHASPGAKPWSDAREARDPLPRRKGRARREGGQLRCAPGRGGPRRMRGALRRGRRRRDRAPRHHRLARTARSDARRRRARSRCHVHPAYGRRRRSGRRTTCARSSPPAPTR